MIVCNMRKERRMHSSLPVVKELQLAITCKIKCNVAHSNDTDSNLVVKASGEGIPSPFSLPELHCIKIMPNLSLATHCPQEISITIH